MSKGLEALKEINKVIPYAHITDEYKIIEKELKALEIIKEKRVNVDKLIYYIMCDTKNKMGLTWYNRDIDYYDYKLTQEEYDLLKEVLGD